MMHPNALVFFFLLISFLDTRFPFELDVNQFDGSSQRSFTINHCGIVAWNIFFAPGDFDLHLPFKIRVVEKERT
jgi:hypothetical protein